jgi:hypothetical protein
MLGVAAVLAASIAFDVGHSATRGNRASDLRSLVSQVKTDLTSCNASAGDSFAAYTEVVGGRHDELGAAKSIIGGDQPYCTPVGNTDLYDLATLEVPGTLRTYNLQPAVQELSTWAYPDAAAAITDVGQMLAHPSDAGARQDLTARLNEMAQLDRSAQASFDRAAAALGTSVDNMNLGAADQLGAG